MIGGYPENFGKPSKYTEGTAFLGTPKDHLEVLASALVVATSPTYSSFKMFRLIKC